jgi:putative endonuclease
MTNKPNGTLYVGMTGNLLQRVAQHRNGSIEGFTKKYGLKRLVHYEIFAKTRPSPSAARNG